MALCGFKHHLVRRGRQHIFKHVSFKPPLFSFRVDYTWLRLLIFLTRGKVGRPANRPGVLVIFVKWQEK